MKTVVKFYKRKVFLFIFLVLFTFIYTFTILLFPYILKDIIDGIKANFTTQKLLHSILILGILGILRALFGVLLPYLRGRTNELFLRTERTNCFSEIVKKGHSFANRFPTGDIIERIDGDLSELSWFSCSGIFRPLEGICTIIFALFFLIKIDLRLTIISVLPMTLSIFAWMRLGPYIYKYYRRWRELISKGNNYLSATFYGIRIVKSYLIELLSSTEFNRILKERIEVAIKTIKVDAKIGTIFTAIEEIGILLILIFGGMFIIKGHLTIGEFVAFNAYILMLLGPMINIGNFFVVKKRADVQIKRIEEMKDYPPDVTDTDKEKISQVKNLSLNCRNLYFRYNKNTPDVLKNINLTMPAGKKIGIVGTVGSGKTTLVKLLMHLAPVIAGEILLNGENIKQINLDSYRGLFGYVPQEPLLFSETLYNNILFGRKVESAKITEAVKFAQLEDFVRTCPCGLKEMVGERGLKLSGGEKQRVAIARAIISEPKILIFDDATSNLDADTERSLINHLSKRLDMTMVIISHRLSILTLCDYLYVLNKGEIVEAGTHHELIKKKGLYWKLYQHQIAEETLEKI